VTFRDWLLTVAFPLNDAEPGREFQRYTLRDLVAAYNAAMCLVAKYRKDLFTEYKVVPLVAGKYQDARGCCGEVLDVLDQTDADGNLIRPINGARERRTTAKRNWKKATCLRLPDGLDYVVENANIDRNMHGRFSVDPPVPCGVEAFVKVKCVSPPCPYTEADMNVQMQTDCIHLVAAWHYVLATMLAGDQFANAAGGNKNYHYRMFFDILGVVQRQEDRIENREEATQ
jgi:hypothetical protein